MNKTKRAGVLGLAGLTLALSGCGLQSHEERQAETWRCNFVKAAVYDELNATGRRLGPAKRDPLLEAALDAANCDWIDGFGPVPTGKVLDK